MSRSSGFAQIVLALAIFAAIPAVAQQTTAATPRLQSTPLVFSPEEAKQKADYVEAVTSGKGVGYMPWQEHGLSQKEIDFRNRMENRKTTLLAGRGPIQHPVLVDAKAHERVVKNIAGSDWAKKVADKARERADFIVSQPDSYVDAMISTTTPWYDYGMVCPNCVGDKSKENTGEIVLLWSYKDPDKLTCKMCGHVYPSEQYPETLKLFCPRMNQTLTFYQSPAERAHPDDHTGQYAYKYGQPLHDSFSGLIIQYKALFMIDSLGDLSLTYMATQDPKYARRAQQILLRLAACYRGWLQHDFLQSVIDADPLYAAWHETELELVWKRRLTSKGYARDTLHKAATLSYWASGRLLPSISDKGALIALARAYDAVADATDESGKSMWSDADRAKVERDLFMEWIFNGEPYLGGQDKAELYNNRSARLYGGYAAVASMLKVPPLADTALKGYERLRDTVYTTDGFSTESPGFMMMFMQDMPSIPEALNRFDWPDSFPARKAAGDLFKDPKLRNIHRAMIDQLRPDGTLIPFEDTVVGTRLPADCVQSGIKHYPEFFGGKASLLGDPNPVQPAPPERVEECPGPYSLVNLDGKRLFGDKGLNLKDVYFPNWMTAILRHGSDRDAALLAMNFSPPGARRQGDNLTLYYMSHNNVALGDLGYVHDSPLNNWIASTLSHNLVIVDDKAQPSRAAKRTPKLEQMLSTPRASAVEASSDAASSTTEYRRLAILLKGPNEQTCAIDIFRVKGGKKHSYQLFSEIASSDAGDKGALVFEGVTLPPEPPLPNFGTSLLRDHIFGLRDQREAKAPAAWTATWTEPGRHYRFRCLSQADTVMAANGPGHESLATSGRRVRYLNLIHEGPNDNTASTFVGVHEPSLPDGSMPVKSARRLEVPAAAGPEAVAVEIETVWGSYIVLSEFAGETTLAGVTFQGKLGIFGTDAKGKPWYLASGATTLRRGAIGFTNKPAEWTGTLSAQPAPVKRTFPAALFSKRGDAETLLAAGGRPAGWSDPPKGCRAYVILNVAQNVPRPNLGRFDTGYPVARTSPKSIVTERFPIPAETTNGFRLSALRYSE